MIRVDPFTTIHKAVRALLFEVTLEAARVELASNWAVDALTERIERTLTFADDHARHEDAELLPLICRVDPAIAARLAAEHLEQEGARHEVCRAVRRLGIAAPEDRRTLGQQLRRSLEVLTARHLLHMHHEETVGNAVLWGSYGDPELAAARARLWSRVEARRRAEWRALLAGAVDPTERALVTEDEVG